MTRASARPPVARPTRGRGPVPWVQGCRSFLPPDGAQPPTGSSGRRTEPEPRRYGNGSRVIHLTCATKYGVVLDSHGADRPTRTDRGTEPHTRGNGSCQPPTRGPDRPTRTAHGTKLGRTSRHWFSRPPTDTDGELHHSARTTAGAAAPCGNDSRIPVGRGPSPVRTAAAYRKDGAPLETFPEPRRFARAPAVVPTEGHGRAFASGGRCHRTRRLENMLEFQQIPP